MNKKNVASNYLVMAINLGFPIIITPVVSNLLGKTDFGVFSVIQVIYVLISAITDFGLSVFGTREITARHHPLEKVFWSSKVIRLTIGALGSLFLILALYFLKTIPVNFYSCFSIVAVSIGYALSPFWAANGLENTHRIISVYTVSRLFSTAIFILITFYYKNLWVSVIIFSITILLPNLLAFLVFLKTANILRFSFVSLSLIPEILKIGWPTAISSIMSVFFNGSVVIIVKGYFGFEVAAGYSVADRICRALLSVFAPLTNSLLPYVSSGFILAYNEGSKRILRTTFLLVPIYTLSAFLFSIFGTFLLSIFGKQYEEYITILQLLLLWSIFSIINNILGIQFLVALGKNRLYSSLFYFSSVILLLSYFILPRIFGINGIPYSLILSEGVFMVLLCIAVYITDREKSKQIV
ncbi:oligosaccharide flippase family protein [Deinococcus ruber]|uniref:oligosaccharide flippase family protein n=1 Tax=Deinococcus ruber TaxID=1848197 RepID=UPI001668AC84|nr:oligosaccharide flippase family protein [Deinococcus ruber]